MLGVKILGLFSSLNLINHVLAVPAHEHVEHRRHGYNLIEEYKPHDFFDKFEFFQYPDPTDGFVQYVGHKEANETGLIRIHKNHTHPVHSYVYMGVDHTNTYRLFDEGRKSVRIQTRKAYTRGLFILNLDHMPHGCGTWPAWWTVGPRWPYDGEIDIIEGVNNVNYNLMSLHTGEGCTIAGAEQKGELITNNCDSVREDVGCGVLRNASTSYGNGFNKRGGGVYAMEWTASFIKIWQWSHHNVPKSILEGVPDPSEFGKPAANMAGSCNMNEHFKNHQVVFDTTFCGNYAGYDYGQSSCPLSNLGHLGCNEFVAQNPTAFKDAYWKIRSMHVYQKHGADVEIFHQPQYTSVIPVVSKAPHSATSLLPHGMGHSTSKHPTSTRTASTSKHHLSSTETIRAPSTSRTSISHPLRTTQTLISPSVRHSSKFSTTSTKESSKRTTSTLSYQKTSSTRSFSKTSPTLSIQQTSSLAAQSVRTSQSSSLTTSTYYTSSHSYKYPHSTSQLSLPTTTTGVEEFLNIYNNKQKHKQHASKSEKHKDSKDRHRQHAGEH